MRRRFVLLVVLLAGVFAVYWLFGDSVTVEKDDRPAFRIDPDKPFLIALGRGSGWHGLDTIKVTQDGRVSMVRQRRHHDGTVMTITWERGTIELPPDAVSKVLASIEKNRLMKLHRSYSAGIYDGVQWVLWIKQGDQEKSVYLDNHFPRQIIRFSEQVDEIIGAHSAGLVWQPSDGPDHRDLWDSIER